ncbi:MAG: DMT family transporter [Anaerovoracaceae bacterium]
MTEKWTSKNWVFYVLVVICALFWGLSFLGTKVALQELAPLQVLSLRWTIAAAIFIVLVVFRIIKVDFKNKPRKILFWAGVTQPCLYSIFETNGVNLTTTSESSIMIATIPLATLLIGAVLLKKIPTKRVVLTIIMAFVGVATCIVFAPNFSIGSKGIGYLVLFGAIIIGAAYTHISNEASKSYSPLELTFFIAMMGCVFFNSVSFAMGYGFSGYVTCFSDTKILIAILFLGICCSCICYIIFNVALARLPAALASNITANSTTVIGVISGVVIAGDAFGWYTVVGLVLTIAGIILSTTGKIKDKDEIDDE